MATNQLVSLPVSFENKPKDEIQLLAFAFTRKGELIEKTFVKEGKADFRTLEQNTDQYRFLIAPDNEKNQQAENFDELKRLKAYEPVLEFTEKGAITLLPLPDLIFEAWWRRRCRVRGQVIKAFTLHGITEDKPVCFARVHICEVDRILLVLPTIPDWIIKKIPEYVLNPDFPIPIPEPEPWQQVAGTQVLFNDALNPNNLQRASANTQLFSPASLPNENSLQQSAMQQRRVVTNQVQKFTPEISSALMSGSVNAIRNIISTNLELFHPIFCNIPWLWPYFYRCDEIKTVLTDANGRFDTYINYSIFGDHPDLYFWVEYFIGGVWTTVYRPSVACHTYWNFACGSEITIRVTDPRVPWRCDDVLGGELIWIKTVGHSTSVSRIWQQNTTGTTTHGHIFNKQGLTDVTLPYSPNTFGDYRRPFASNMYFLVQFSALLPKDGLKYFKWSARKVKNADLSAFSGSWKSLKNPLSKGYNYSYYVGTTLRQDGSDSYPLGPVNVGTGSDLFLIPPFDVNSIAKPGQLFSWWGDGQNTVAVYFDSKSLDGDGLYEFKMELFDKNGNKIEVPPTMFQVPHPATFAPHINAPLDNLSINFITGNARAFRMMMRVDNNAAEAQVFKIKTDTDNDGVFIDASPNCCGFVQYNGAADTNNQLRISFRAYHPHNFADFFFGVVKGTCGDTLASDSAIVIGSTAKYNRNAASVFSHDYSPNELLGDCALKPGPNGGMIDGKAAFAETLSVQPLAVDGNWQAFGTASTVAAFALEPV
jgi:hypothetical protein